MAAKVKSKSSFQIHSLIMLVLMCSDWFLPEGNILTEYGVRISMIFLGCIGGWIFVGLVESSLLALVFLVLAGAGTAKEVVGAGFGSEIIVMVVFFCVFTQWLEDIGLTTTVAKWLLSRKFLAGKPYLFIFMIFFVTFLCGDLCNHLPDVGDLLSYSQGLGFCTKEQGSLLHLDWGGLCQHHGDDR